MHPPLVALVAAFLAPAALGAQASRARPEVYSSMRYIGESGDVVGTEVVVLRGARRACVSYQLAEGAPEPRRVVRAEVRGDSLVFRIPPDSAYAGGTRRLVEVGPARWFRGRMAASGLRARIEGEGAPIWLPRRQRAYFQAAERELSNESLQLTNARSALTESTAPTPRVCS